ncbi:hypothetical protein SNE40_019292 [Patella caerulea]|uniref:DDE Tnp4 domain-containing protein n=1 Tax=Patella caerulea TaxID=87958 RepID=A0AAN8J6B8_PATCE
MVLADRGFPIAEELMIKGASLYIPPGARGMEQMTKDNVLKTKKVANLRIHVERAINRMKWFRILSQTLPISMAPLIDDILTVCAIIVNLYPPLVQ